MGSPLKLIQEGNKKRNLREENERKIQSKKVELKAKKYKVMDVFDIVDRVYKVRESDRWSLNTSTRIHTFARKLAVMVD
jgi:hypothetical protein